MKLRIIVPISLVVLLCLPGAPVFAGGASDSANYYITAAIVEWISIYPEYPEKTFTIDAAMYDDLVNGVVNGYNNVYTVNIIVSCNFNPVVRIKKQEFDPEINNYVDSWLYYYRTGETSPSQTAHGTGASQYVVVDKPGTTGSTSGPSNKLVLSGSFIWPEPGSTYPPAGTYTGVITLSASLLP